MIIRHEPGDTICKCDLCKEIYVITRGGFWQNHFLCSAACCDRRREELKDQEELMEMEQEKENA
jgi:hypothetical protein